MIFLPYIINKTSTFYLSLLNIYIEIMLDLINILLEFILYHFFVNARLLLRKISLVLLLRLCKLLSLSLLFYSVMSLSLRLLMMTLSIQGLRIRCLSMLLLLIIDFYQRIPLINQ